MSAAPSGVPAGTPAGTVAGTAAGPGAASAAAPAPSEDESVGTGEVAAGSTSARARRRLPDRPSWPLVAVLLAVALLALTALAYVLLRTPPAEAVRASALEAARTYTTSLTTFDARTFDEDVARVQRASTEQFAGEYQTTIDGLRQSVQAEQTASVGTVVGAGVESIEGSTAQVIVAVDQQVSSGAAAPRTEAGRLRMTLVRADGQWRIGGVERL